MDVEPKAEKRCIFFLVPLILGCTIVAAVTVEVVHLLMKVLSGYPVTDHWPVFLAVGLGVAAVIALVRRARQHHLEKPRHPRQTLEMR